MLGRKKPQNSFLQKIGLITWNVAALSTKDTTKRDREIIHNIQMSFVTLGNFLLCIGMRITDKMYSFTFYELL